MWTISVATIQLSHCSEEAATDSTSKMKMCPWKLFSERSRLQNISANKIIKMLIEGLPGGPVVKDPLANARDMGFIPDPGRSHTLQSN